MHVFHVRPPGLFKALWLSTVLPLLLCMVVGLARPCLAQHLVLDNLVVDNQADRIMVRFALHMDDADHLAMELENGAKLGLTAEAELYQDRSMMWSRELAEGEYISILRYDSLTRDYILERPGEDSPLRDRDLDVLLRRGWESISLDLGRWTLLTPGKSFFLDVNIRMEHLEVPGWMKSVLFFWDWNAVPVTSYRMSFEY